MDVHTMATCSSGLVQRSSGASLGCISFLNKAPPLQVHSPKHGPCPALLDLATMLVAVFGGPGKAGHT